MFRLLQPAGDKASNMGKVKLGLALGAAALTLMGLIFAFTPVLQGLQAPRVRETVTVTFTWVEAATSTSMEVVSYETYGVKNSLSNRGGEWPADIREVVFSLKREALSVKLQVSYGEGFARPYSYGVFISDSPEKGKYCLLFLPWPRDDPKAMLINLKDHSHRDYGLEIKGLTAETIIPLEALQEVFVKDASAGGSSRFYAWASSWAYDFVPLNRLEEREHIWLFDDLPPTEVSLSPTTYTTASTRFYTAVEASTRLKTATKIASKPQASWWGDVLAPAAPWTMAAVLIALLWRKR